jgi:hypothetical protein
VDRPLAHVLNLAQLKEQRMVKKTQMKRLDKGSSISGFFARLGDAALCVMHQMCMGVGQRIATPCGKANPEPSALMVGDGGMLPPTASISFTALLKVSAT